MVLTLLLILSAFRVQAANTPPTVCEGKIQQVLQNNPTYFSKFHVLSGELSGRKILSFTLRNPRGKKLVWKDPF